MSHAEGARGKELLHPVGQLEQPERVGDARPVPADALADLLLCQPELLDEPSIALGLLEGVEVGALEVLDQGQLEGLGRRDVTDHGRDLVQARELRGPPAALAGDESVVGPVAPHEHRLDDALGPD